MNVTLRRNPVLQVGAVPRANLLPPSILAFRRDRRNVRMLLMALVLAVVIALLATGVAGLAAAATASQLQAEQARTLTLLAQQSEYSEAGEASATLAATGQALAVAGATDVDWSEYIAEIEKGLPDGMALTGVQLKATTPISVVDQPVAPLQGARVATLTLTASSADLPELELWLNSLADLPGYVDSNPGSVISAEGGFLTVVTLGVNAEIYSNRFVEEAAQ